MLAALTKFYSGRAWAAADTRRNWELDEGFGGGKSWKTHSKWREICGGREFFFSFSEGEMELFILFVGEIKSIVISCCPSGVMKHGWNLPLPSIARFDYRRLAGVTTCLNPNAILHLLLLVGTIVL